VSRSARLGLFALGGPGLLAVLLIGLHGLPAFGHFHGVYGLLVNRIEPVERHATDIVTALNFDIRAYDTLGEEFILFASVSGVALLLRHLRGEAQNATAAGIEDHRFAGASAGLRLASLVLKEASCSLPARWRSWWQAGTSRSSAWRHGGPSRRSIRWAHPPT
jgi:hypothetical protein